jgi:Amiloride-sensitive sodium channel
MFCPDIEIVEAITEITKCNDCVKELQKILIPIKEIFVKCKFRNQVIDCTKSFIQTVVSNQICYTFNELGFHRNHNERNMDEMNKDWSVDEGYHSTAIDTFPNRALGAGRTFGLSILMRSDKKHFDYYCSQYDGFAVWIEKYNLCEMMQEFFIY